MTVEKLALTKNLLDLQHDKVLLLCITIRPRYRTVTRLSSQTA